MNNVLWNTLAELKGPKYRWVDLTHELSPETPHWYGFKPLEGTLLFDYMPGTPEDMAAPMRCIQYSVASQYGTHVDAPRHFHEHGRTMAQIGVKELVFPLCVIDKSAECAKDPDFMLTVDDILAWEAEYGRIPEGAFVAFRSDWYVKPNLDNPDENGQPHYPGWDVNAIRWLVEERNIGAIGHEPADTDPAKVTTKPDAYPYPGEQYILSVDRFQIEVMRNLDQCPPTGALIVCSFPRLRDGVGFPARCFAICPND
ncbi:MAG TPA: cyclase family protein [Candidatus Scatomorpha stercoravium]|nr:cyclase family protein [Candidatus Scatomorpha stercoravium]